MWSCERSSSSQREPLKWWQASATEAGGLGLHLEELLPTDPPPVRASPSPPTQQRPAHPRWEATPAIRAGYCLILSQPQPLHHHHDFPLIYLLFNLFLFFLITLAEFGHFVVWFLCFLHLVFLVVFEFVNPFLCLLICHCSPESPTHNPQLW